MTLPPSGPRPVDPRAPSGSAPASADPAQAVERALVELDGLAERPLVEHVAVFERLHAALGDALAAGSGAGEAAGRA
jgi:hypothetical protein